MKIKPCAKINLGLNVVSKRADGYHDLETVFYPVPIYDEIEIREATETKFEIKGQPVEGDAEKNLVVLAYRMVAERYTLPPVHIILDKQIPMQAGMGGGSADGAFTIRLLNEQFDLNMSTAEMEQMAARLGADCPFFIQATPAYAEGIGERLSPIPLDLSRYCMVVVKPPVAVSTREAFGGIKVKRPARNCRDIIMQPIDTWREQLVNDFEDSIFPLYPQLADIKRRLYELGARYAAMSGSGSALFAFFDEAPSLEKEFRDCKTWIL
ncbi:MAG: 4-(cytidine 5'-diphospho)-2-C-methyl-D-erythritol kinase [Prevotella sp.]|nr:4-(cytidine 5'-diphospho)-2-C-methyl-D-erythritol kinase [Prevotella sp.]